MTGIQAPGASLRGARLEVADLSYGNFENADLRDCQVMAAHFVKSTLRRATLRFPENPDDRTQDRAFFSDARMEEAMVGGDLIGAYFQFPGTPDSELPRELRGVRLRNARVGRPDYPVGDDPLGPPFRAEWLEACFGDASVTLAGGQVRPSHWPARALGPQEFEAEWRKWQSDPEGYRPPD